MNQHLVLPSIDEYHNCSVVKSDDGNSNNGEVESEAGNSKRRATTYNRRQLAMSTVFKSADS